MHSTDDLVECFGQVNGHVCKHFVGFQGFDGGYGVVRGIRTEYCYLSFVW